MAFLQLNYHSQVLGMDTGVYIIMPEKSQEIGQKGMSGDIDEFPVLWLLHGRSNDETMWLRKTSIERYVGSLGMMVVMPSVGYSRYQNMKYGPRYYDFMTEELPAFLKKMFPKMSMEREKNYLAGLSMGGGGSMHIGLRNTDKYGTICMLSTGGVPPLEGTWRNEPSGVKESKDLLAQQTNFDIYGVADTDTLAGTEYDILKLIRDTAEQHKVLPKVYHAMGVDDKRYPVAMAIKDTFESIPGNPYRYEYHEGPGSHEWGFWDTWIKNFLDSLSE